jgi:hypothetical protein
MSRSDFWSIAATLIVAGVAYFVGGQKTAYGCIGLGVLIALYLLATHKKNEPVPASASANAQATANPHIAVNPNMSTNLHLHLSDKQEKPPLSSPKPEPHHNLRLHSCKMLQIEESLGPHGEMGGFHSTDDQSKPNAAVVCIKNKSQDGEVADLYDIRAALIFRDSSGEEIGNGIHRALWVNNHVSNASFDLEETKCVIVACVKHDTDGDIVGATAPYIRELPTNHGITPIVEAYELGENLETVELILLAKTSRVMEPMVFEFFDDDGELGIRLAHDNE